jgi:hypothetical protein
MFSESEVGEVKKISPKELAVCVKIGPSIKNMKKNLMCYFGYALTRILL